MDQQQTVKYLRDAIPQGPHPEPHAEWIQVRLDVVQGAIDTIEWKSKGNAEWRDLCTVKDRQLKAVQASARTAIGHLQAVLNKSRTHAEQQAADTAARDWLLSIGSEPT
jgi:hypothetical protein